MNTSDQEKIEAQLAAYAIGALDLSELAELERALAASPAHQEELRQLREVVALLPFAAPAADPPAHVRERLLARIAAAQAPRPAAPAPRPAAPAPPRPRLGWLAPALIAGLAALVLLFGGMTLSLQRSVAGLDSTNRELVATLSQLTETLAENRARQDELTETLAASQARQEELANQLAAGQLQIAELSRKLDEEQYVVSFVSAPGVATRQLNAVASGAQARGEMYMYPGEQSAVVIFSGLPDLAPGKVYQFWLADGQNQVGGGTFEVDERGIATLVVDAPREVNAFSEVMVTVEPSGGSTAPSADVVLEGSL